MGIVEDWLGAAYNKVNDKIAAASAPAMSGFDAFKAANPGLSEAEAKEVFYGIRASSGGGSGSSGPDHFFDVSGDTAATLAARAEQDSWQNQFDQSQFKWKQAQDERNYALAVGDMDLAKQKQADSNYWQGISAKLEEARMGLTARGQDMDYAAAMANVAARKEESDKQFQVGMAGARNDEERNRITAAWNAEQAAIAKMEDETRRILGGQQNQTSQFAAETDRAAAMGRLGLDTNKFILEASSTPRNLPGFFMMQRGIAPDWDQLAAGGQTSGASLVPAKIMDAYVPQTAAPVFNGTPVNSAASQVGAATQYRPGTNQFIGAFQGSSGGSASSVPAAAAATFAPWTGGSITGDMTGPPKLEPTKVEPLRVSDGKGHTWFAETQAWMNDSDGSRYVETPTAAKGGVFGGTVMVGDQPSGKPTGHEELATPFINAQGQPSLTIQPINEKGIKAQNQATRPIDQMYRGADNKSRMFADFGMGRVADALQRQRAAKAAQASQPAQSAPAPVAAAPVQPTAHAQALATPAQAQSAPAVSGPHAAAPVVLPPQTITSDYVPQGSELRDPVSTLPAAAMAKVRSAPWNPMPIDFPGQTFAYAPPVNRGIAPFTPPGLQFSPGQAVPEPFFWRNNGGIDTRATGTALPARAQTAANQYWESLRSIPRFAIGTDNSAAYTSAGMGNSWIATSDNPYLQGKELPPMLDMLVKAGFPVDPATGSAATGSLAPTLNTAAAVRQRGGGALPSLQALGRQTKSETEATRGYYEGPVGVPWADLVDFIGKPTQHLRSAGSSRLGV